MNHAGEITPLVAMVRPHVALVTTIAPVHIEYLGSIEAIAEAKAEIFTGVEPGGTIVLNRDAPQFALLEKRAQARRSAKSQTFGADAGRRCAAFALRARRRRRARCARRSTAARFRSGLARPACIWRRTRWACCSPLQALGADLDEAAAALAEFSAQKGRGARLTLQAAERRLSR